MRNGGPLPISETILPLRASKLALAQPRTVNPLMPGAKLQALSPKPCHACRLKGQLPIRFTMDLHHLLWLRPALECFDTYDNAGHTSRHSFSRVSQASPYSPKCLWGIRHATRLHLAVKRRNTKERGQKQSVTPWPLVETHKSKLCLTFPSKTCMGVATCNVDSLPKTIRTDVTGAQHCTLCFPHERTACSQNRSHRLA